MSNQDSEDNMEPLELTPEQMEELNQPATKAEVLVAVSQVTQELQYVVDQFNQYIEQVLTNQKVINDRLEALEDPAKPRIYLP